MEIIKGIGIVDLALFIREQKTLVISDLHIGYEEELNKKGFLVPRMHFKDTIERLDKIIQKTQPETIIINGDLKHEFGRISRQEWNDVVKIIEFIENSSNVMRLLFEYASEIHEAAKEGAEGKAKEQFLNDIKTAIRSNRSKGMKRLFLESKVTFRDFI